MINIWFRIAASLMFLGVALGAFGVHGLKARLAPELMQVYQTGVFYHFIHAIGLFIVAWAISENCPKARWAGYAFVFGILIFSGSLYVLSLTSAKWLGAVTPIGGLLFLIGWAVLALA